MAAPAPILAIAEEIARQAERFRGHPHPDACPRCKVSGRLWPVIFDGSLPTACFCGRCCRYSYLVSDESGKHQEV